MKGAKEDSDLHFGSSQDEDQKIKKGLNDLIITARNDPEGLASGIKKNYGDDPRYPEIEEALHEIITRVSTKDPKDPFRKG